MDILGAALSVAQWAADKAWKAARSGPDLRLELTPTVVFAPSAVSQRPALLATIYNRGRPQVIEAVHPLLSDGRPLDSLGPNGDFPSLPRPVSETENCKLAFDVDELRVRLADRAGGRPLRVAGVWARLASGRTVKLRKKVDVHDREAFPAGAAFR
jgi:hypothetical protein